MSFLVCPLLSNLTSIMSPSTEMTVPGPKVLWLTASPAAKTSAARAASGRRCSTVCETGLAPVRAGDAVKVEGLRPASGLTPRWRSVPATPKKLSNEPDVAPEPPVERVREPNTRPPYISDPCPEPKVPRRSPRFSQPVPEKPADPMPENSMSSDGISPTKRERGFA